jgi:DNA-directed RNA polymerase specialized sigma24 family protein
LQTIVNLLPEKSRRMLNYRILGFAWSEIGRALRISEKQAKKRFYYALNKVRATLLDSGAKGAGHSEESD